MGLAAEELNKKRGLTRLSHSLSLSTCLSLSFARLTYLVPYNTVNIIETFSSLSTLVAVRQFVYTTRNFQLALSLVQCFVFAFEKQSIKSATIPSIVYTIYNKSLKNNGKQCQIRPLASILTSKEG